MVLLIHLMVGLRYQYNHILKKGKLIKLLWNRANGFLEYKIEDFRKDSMLYHSLDVDTFFIKNKEKFLKHKTSTTRNDTIFYKDNQKNLIYIE